MKRSFPPVVNEHVRVLVLGSLPGEQSLAAARYYANPRNQFWRLMSDVVGKELVPLDYQERLDTLLEARVGLWDSIESAVREGSLDASIRGHSANAVAELTSRLPELRAIGFNGGTSARIGMKALEECADYALLPLPSSSPAFTLAFKRKREAWLKLRSYL